MRTSLRADIELAAQIVIAIAVLVMAGVLVKRMESLKPRLRLLLGLTVKSISQRIAGVRFLPIAGMVTAAYKISNRSACLPC